MQFKTKKVHKESKIFFSYKNFILFIVAEHWFWYRIYCICGEIFRFGTFPDKAHQSSSISGTKLLKSIQMNQIKIKEF